MRPARTGLKAALASAAAVALLSTGGAFAASGHAPWAHAPVSATGASADHTQPTHPTPSHSESTDDPTDDPTDGTDTSTGPNAHAMWGLCHAYLAGSKTEHGQALQSPAFTALALAAGGPDLVADFCSAVPKPGSGDQSGDPSHPAHPTHPAKPTQAASPTHPTHPAKPTQAASPTRPAHPTHPPSPSRPAHPSHSTAPSSNSSAHSRP